jgi:dipeptidyl aminopeptidase/acylaminoacyl peptidase
MPWVFCARLRSLVLIGTLAFCWILLPCRATFAEAASAGFVAPAENLVVEGIPEVPIKLVDALRPYTQIRSTRFCGWHPDRREMLVAAQPKNSPQIHKVDAPGAQPKQLTFFKEPVTDASYTPCQGNYFVFARDTGGDEKYQKYRFDFETDTVSLLTDGESRNTSCVWSYAGDKFAYGSTRRTNDDVDIWIATPNDKEEGKVVCQLEGGGWAPLDFSPDDQQLLVVNRLSANESYLWLVDVPSGKKKLLTPKREKESVSYEGGQFSHDGTSVFVATDRDHEFHRLASIRLSDSEHTYLTNIPWNVSQVKLSHDGATLAFVTNEDGRDVLRLLDVASGKERVKPDVPVGIITGLEWHKNNRDLGFTFQDSQRGADCYSLDATTGRMERWTSSSTGGLDVDSFSVPQLIHWKSFDERTISGWLTPPPKKFTGKRPVVIVIHGGPESQARPILRNGHRYLVNELGVAIIQPNVRGSDGYGKTFLALDNGFKREDSYKDIGALLDWIKTRDDLDADRIMITGGSYGGFMTLAVASQYADRIRCALDLVGPSNLTTFLENTSGYRRDLRRVEYGDERDPKMREFHHRIAPMTNAAKITKPLFVVQGGNDPRVPLSESEQIVQIVRKNGGPVWYLMAKDEGHGFHKKPNEDFLRYATVLFLQQYLLN